jgi:hypothetical protein
LGRIYDERAVETTLSAGVTASTPANGGTISVVSTEGYPSPTGGDTATFVIDYDDAALIETISYTGKTGTTFTGVTRGVGKNGAKAHASGAKVRHGAADVDLEVLGDAVRLTGAQTIAGVKTFTEDQTIAAVKALLLSDVGAVQATGAGAGVNFTRNARYNGTDYIRTTADNGASLLQFHPNGDLVFSTNTDAGATVGSTITWGEKFRITKAGLLTANNHKRGAGTPEGVVTGNVGDSYQRSDGAVGTTLYVKETGSGNTGWKAVGSSGVQVAQGSYTGDETVGRVIALAFTPKFVYVSQETADTRNALSNVNTGTYGGAFHTSSAAERTNSDVFRPRLTTNGFVVSGPGAGINNGNGNIHHYFAIG